MGLCLKGHVKGDIAQRFPDIFQRCLEEGYDITKECIPVAPAQHYLMGGISVALEGQTSMDRLYAVGETSCNGVHGKNRLASNSLLESLVFSKRAAQDILANWRPASHPPFPDPIYPPFEDLMADYRRLVIEEIRKEKENEQPGGQADPVSSE